MSTVFHPQMDGATERVNCSIGQILQTIIQDDQRNWADKFPMVELTLNSNISVTMGLAPFEITRGHMPRIGLPLTSDTKFQGVKWFMQQARWNLMAAHDAIIERCIVQRFHANRKHRPSNKYKPGNHVYLSTQNLTLPRGRARKLVPRFIGPYTVKEVHNAASTVTLELPKELTRR